MNRRDMIALLGGAAMLPVAARAGDAGDWVSQWHSPFPAWEPGGGTVHELHELKFNIGFLS